MGYCMAFQCILNTLQKKTKKHSGIVAIKLELIKKNHFFLLTFTDYLYKLDK